MGDAGGSASKLEQLKNEAKDELMELDQQMNEIEKMKDDSIEKLEGKKIELKGLSDMNILKQQHEQTLQELEITKAEIEARKLSIAMMDQTITTLDEQISKIQAEHDRVAGEISVKKNRLLEKITFYDELKRQIANLVQLLKEADDLFNSKVQEIEKQKLALKNNPDLSPEVLEQSLKELDEGLMKMYQDHEALTTQLKIQIAEDIDPAFKEDILEEINQQMISHPLSETQIKQILERDDEAEIADADKVPLSEEERIMLTKMGLIITPSQRIITKDDKVLTLEEVRRMGVLKTPSGVSKKSKIKQVESEESEESIQEILEPEEQERRELKRKERQEKKEERDRRRAEGEEVESEDEVDLEEWEKKEISKEKAKAQKAKDRASKASARTLGEIASTKEVGDTQSKRGIGETGSRKTVGETESRKTVGETASRKTVGETASRKTVGETASRKTVGETGSRKTLGETGSRKTVGETESTRGVGETESKKRMQGTESKRDTQSAKLKMKESERRRWGKEHIGEESYPDISGELYDETHEEIRTDADHYPYDSFITQVTSISDLSSDRTESEKPDVEYLKKIFGKALSLGLAEITQVQPFDPIHYLAHWLFKYRYNQEIDEVKQRELEALLAERERIDRETTHAAIEAEAKQAVLDAWLRAEDLILDQELAAAMAADMGGEEEILNDYNYENEILNT